MIHPSLRCSSTPCPGNAACVRRMKSPDSLRHANWNSSRVAHMLVPEPAMVYVCAAASYDVVPAIAGLPTSPLASK